MHKNAYWLGSVALVLALTACGGGNGTNSIVNTGSGGSGGATQGSISSGEDLFNLDGSNVLNELEQDAGYTAQPLSERSIESNHTLETPGGPFTLQITGGTATIARAKSKTEDAVAFLMTYRDSKGLCECSNDNPKLPKPPGMMISNPLWISGQPFPAKASTTVLLIGEVSGKDSSNHGGTYTGKVPKPPATGSFALSKTAPLLGTQTAPTVSFKGNALAGCAVGSAYVTWKPTAGTNEYFVDFLTHFNDNPKNGFVTAGFVITNGTDTCVPSGNFYSKAQYQVMLIAADTAYINIYTSQGIVQAPKLPTEIDFAISPLTTFTTP